MTREDAKRHLAQLARENRVELIFDPTLPAHGAMTNTAERIIYLPTWEQLTDWRALYWAALHEFGHVVHRHTKKDRFRALLGIPELDDVESEAEAWQWAFDHGQDDLSNGLGVAKAALGGYAAGAIQDSPEHDYRVGRAIRDVARRILGGSPNDELGAYAIPGDDPGYLTWARRGWNDIALRAAI